MNEVLECAELVDNSKDDFLDSIIVFGSVARKESSQSSDIDFFLTYNCDIMDENFIIQNDIIKSKIEISRKLFKSNRRADFIFSNLIDKESTLYKNILKDGIKVYERSKS